MEKLLIFQVVILECFQVLGHKTSKKPKKEQIELLSERERFLPQKK